MGTAPDDNATPVSAVDPSWAQNSALIEDARTNVGISQLDPATQSIVASLVTPGQTNMNQVVEDLEGVIHRIDLLA